MKSVKLCQIVISISIPIRVPNFKYVVIWFCLNSVLFRCFLQLLALLLIFNASEINIPWYLLRSTCWGPDASRFARKKTNRAPSDRWSFFHLSYHGPSWVACVPFEEDAPNFLYATRRPREATNYFTTRRNRFCKRAFKCSGADLIVHLKAEMFSFLSCLGQTSCSIEKL